MYVHTKCDVLLVFVHMHSCGISVNIYCVIRMCNMHTSYVHTRM